MRVTIGDVECPKCGHIFNADTGWMEFKPFKSVEDAEIRCMEMNEEHPDRKHIVEKCDDGWIISSE